MTIEEFAKMIDGREYQGELMDQEEKQARALGFVVAFGASDDLLELRGAINDEHNAPGAVVVVGNKLLPDPDEREEEVLRKYGAWDAFQKKKKVGIAVKAEWCPDGSKGPSWRITPSVPFAKFNVMEDGEVYCEGAVFSIV